jgi:uncharacterized protein YkwD
MNLLTVALLTMTTSAAPSNGAGLYSRAQELLPIEQNIVQQTNSQRVRYGLPALQIDTQLMESARQHAAWMASRRVLQHGSAAAAENIAMGQSSSHEAVQDWMQSPGHRANILNFTYSRIGVGAYRAADGQIYWCQQFQW